jgi:hypothetical protein
MTESISKERALEIGEKLMRAALEEGGTAWTRIVPDLTHLAGIVRAADREARYGYVPLTAESLHEAIVRGIAKTGEKPDAAG